MAQQHYSVGILILYTLRMNLNFFKREEASCAAVQPALFLVLIKNRLTMKNIFYIIC